MYEPNVAKVLQLLGPTDRVLDVGGWACPFNRAQWVLDSEPFETRGYYRTFGGAASQGGADEWFSRDTWVQRDICDKTPWPFQDKHFDFVICSHTLEDIRDPLWVCSEIIRVGKRGYIEVPSRAFETSLGIERPNQAGLSHHRWLIEIAGNDIVFLHKYHMLHSHWRFALPERYGKALDTTRSVQWLWWTDTFHTREVTIHGVDAQERELERYVRATYPYSPWRVRASSVWRTWSPLPRRAAAWMLRRSGWSR
jgi:hypothetical protein